MKKENLRKLFLVVPKLIDQPTWGGKYILNSKNWIKKKNFRGINIGQSYELFSGTKLRADIASSADSTFTGELGYAMDPKKTFYKGDARKLISLEKMAKKFPEEVLGGKVIKKHGGKIKILIKYTQSKGNSFQVHVREKDESKKWKFKPETWYYLEPGVLTLGLKKGVDIKRYKETCFYLERELKKISKDIITGKIDSKIGQKIAREVVKQNNPWQFINRLKAKKGEIIDLSPCGIHHSWEEDDKYCPEGNIIYELCMDVMDPISSIRSFDKGKIKNDGTLRKLDIDPYFHYLDRSENTNNPQTHMATAKTIIRGRRIEVKNLVRTKYYSMDKIKLGKNKSLKINMEESFNHLFVVSGKFIIHAENSKLTLTKGHSCFVPACFKHYEIKSSKFNQSETLKTFVS
jgi:mannose-6-phosphate isomerase class I